MASKILPGNMAENYTSKAKITETPTKTTGVEQTVTYAYEKM
ncbi:hypothetical protein [Listeria seeligeri]|nr:hypothetical protein [Listeria seeligeri]